MLLRNINAQEKEFEKFLESQTFRTNNKDLTPELRKERRAKADGDDLEFAKLYFPKIFNEPFNDLHRHVAKLHSGRYTVSGGRRFGKSAFSYIVKIIKSLALGIGGIVNLNLRTLELAKERSSSLMRIIQRNKLLMYDYEIKFEQDKKGFYIVNGTYFIAGSFETGLRSIIDDDFKRIRVSINDDLYNKSSVKSESDNKKVVDFIQSEVYGMLEPDGLAITLGNSISETCPIVQLKEDNPEAHYSLPVVDENGHSNWQGHSLYNDEYFKELESRTTLDVWLGEYMDKPCIQGEIFDPSWIRTINLNTVNIVSSLTAIDPSFGKSPEACYKGIITLGLTDKNQTVVLDVYLRKENYFQVFDYVDALRFRMPFWKVLLFENDFSQFSIAEPYYEQWKDERNKVLPIAVFSSKTLVTEKYGADKVSRIMNLIYPHQSGTLVYNDNIIKTNDFKLYRQQYISFGASKEKLDGLDACASAFIMLKRYIAGGTFKPLKKKKMKKNSFLND